MEKSRLAAKQKRYFDFKNSVSEFTDSPQLKVDLDLNLEQYKSILVKVWESNNSNLSQEDLYKIDDIERKLDRIFEDARASNQSNKISM